MSYIGNINEFTITNLPGITDFSGSDYVVDYLYAGSGSLVIGTYSNPAISNHYYSQDSKAEPNPYLFLYITNLNGGGGFYDLSGLDASNCQVYELFNYYDPITTNPATIPATPTIVNLTVPSDGIWFNYEDGYLIYYTDNETLTSIINYTLNGATSFLDNNNIYIVNNDQSGNNNYIYFSKICVANIYFSSQGYKGVPSFAIRNNNQEIYYINILPVPTEQVDTETSIIWQNVTNYVLNLECSFTYYNETPVSTNGIPFFTSVSTNANGTALVVSANDDVYGGIYYLQIPEDCSNFEPNTLSKLTNNPVVDGVVGIKFSSEPCDFCIYQYLSNTIDQSLNDFYDNYIIWIDENNTFHKIAFNFTLYESDVSNCSVDWCLSTPNILTIYGETCDINGPIISLITNYSAPNTVVFITSTQFFISNDTGNNFYNISVGNSPQFTSCAISAGNSSASSSDISGNTSTTEVDYSVIIFLGTGTGSVYQVLTDISGTIQPVRSGSAGSDSSGNNAGSAALSWLVEFILDYFYFTKTIETIYNSGYHTGALNFLFILVIINSCCRFYVLKKTFYKTLCLIWECILYLYFILGIYAGRALRWVSNSKAFSVIGKFCEKVGLRTCTIGMTEFLNYLIVLLTTSFELIKDLDDIFNDNNRATTREGFSNYSDDKGKILRDLIWENVKFLWPYWVIMIHISMISNTICYEDVYRHLLTDDNDDLKSGTYVISFNKDVSNNYINKDISLNDFSLLFKDSFFRMKEYIYVYDFLWINKKYGDMWNCIKNYVNILSNKVNNSLPNSNIEKTLYYLQMIIVTIWVLIIYLIIFWRKNLDRYLSWRKLKQSGGTSAPFHVKFAFFTTIENDETRWKDIFTKYPELLNILYYLAIIWLVDYLICYVIYWIYIFFSGLDSKPYLVIRYQNFVRGFLWYVKNIQKGISDLFEIMFRRILERIKNADIEAKLSSALKNDLSGNDISGNDN